VAMRRALIDAALSGGSSDKPEAGPAEPRFYGARATQYVIAADADPTTSTELMDTARLN
jgi:hypothetical protein